MGMASAACVDAIVWKISRVSFAHHVVNKVKDIGKGTWPGRHTKQRMIWCKGSWYGASYIIHVPWGSHGSPAVIQPLQSLFTSSPIQMNVSITDITPTVLYSITKRLESYRMLWIFIIISTWLISHWCLQDSNWATRDDHEISLCMYFASHYSITQQMLHKVMYIYVNNMDLHVVA